MRVLLTLLAATAALPAAAQTTQPGVPSPGMARALGQSGDTIDPNVAPTVADVANLRVNQIFIFQGDPCPQSNDPEEITVCAVLPDAERFRIPENLRSDPNAPENQAWTNKAIALSYVGATGTGSCSTVGPGGFTGCNQQLINQAVAERRGRPEVNWARLIEQARQERLAGINTAASQEEIDAAGDRRIQRLRIRQGQLCPPSTEAVVIYCTYPDGSSAPVQPAGEPVIPVGGRLPAATPPAGRPQD